MMSPGGKFLMLQEISLMNYKLESCDFMDFCNKENPILNTVICYILL